MRSRRRLIIGGAAAFVVAFIVWLVVFSSVFGVHDVQVVGLKNLTAEQVRQTAAIDGGTPLLRLDTDAVVHRVESLPDVVDAAVDTSWPDSVVITVTERTPIGYVVTADSKYTLIDATGARYRTVSTRPPLPRFVVPQAAEGTDDGADGTDARASAAVAVVAAALPEDIRPKVDSIQALEPEAVTLLMTDKRVVRWGEPVRNSEKARVLLALLAKQNSTIDLTDPSQPFTR